MVGATGVKMTVRNVGKWVKKLGGKLKVTRKSHVKKDAAKVKQFLDSLAIKLKELSPDPIKTRVWLADEHRHGLLPVLRNS